MKRNLFISILFFIATTLMAVHEVQHIEHEHVSCEICVLVNNFVSPDIENTAPNIELSHFGTIDTFVTKFYYHKQSSTCQSRAPPYIS